MKIKFWKILYNANDIWKCCVILFNHFYAKGKTNINLPHICKCNLQQFHCLVKNNLLLETGQKIIWHPSPHWDTLNSIRDSWAWDANLFCTLSLKKVCLALSLRWGVYTNYTATTKHNPPLFTSHQITKFKCFR